MAGLISMSVWHFSVKIIGPYGVLKTDLSVFSELPLLNFAIVIGTPLVIIESFFRDWIWRKVDNEIVQFIKPTANEFGKHFDRKAAKRIFFQIVDVDKSLQQKSERVRIWGTCVSGSLYLMMISSLFPFVVLLTADNCMDRIVSVLILYVLLFVFAALFLFFLRRQHSMHCNEQINSIRQSHMETLKSIVREANVT